jgi:pimeloyl-ACP methyl ester carboxylesterase
VWAGDLDNPASCGVFPAEIYRAPRSWGERAFGNLIHWSEVDKGGHFAAWEQPQLFSEEVRAAFSSLRQPESWGRRAPPARRPVHPASPVAARSP